MEKKQRKLKDVPYIHNPPKSVENVRRLLMKWKKINKGRWQEIMGMGFSCGNKYLRY